MTDEGERGAAEGSGTAGDEPTESSGAPSSGKPGLVRLKWLKINKYRNVRPTTLRFDDGANLVLGLNGSGKTTLLKLLAAVLSGRFQTLASEYDVQYQLDLDGLLVEARAVATSTGRAQLQLFREGPVPAPREVPELARRFGARFSAYVGQPEVSVRLDDDGIYGCVAGEPERKLPGPRIHGGLRAAVSAAASLGIEWLRPAGGDPPAVLVGALDGVARRLDESLENFYSLLGEGDSDDTRLPTPSIHVVADKVVFFSGPWAPHGLWGDVFEAHARGADGIVWDAGSNGLLRTLAERLGAEGVEMRVRFELKTGGGWHYRGLQFLVSQRGGDVIPHGLLSYGQKRLLTFLYYLAVNDYVVVADELVNGLHHSWIQLCLDRIGRRQAFLTSQNPLLLDYLPPSDVAQAQRQFVICRAHKTDTGEELVWENMSEDAAERVMSAYKVGIQSLSEVLESKGLW